MSLSARTAEYALFPVGSSIKHGFISEPVTLLMLFDVAVPEDVKSSSEEDLPALF